MKLDQQFAIWVAAHAMKRPDMLLTTVVIGFIKKMGLDHHDDNALDGIKLVPERWSPAWKGSVRRFVCGYVVGGSDAMYKDGQTPIGLGLWLTGKKAFSRPIDGDPLKEAKKAEASAMKAFKKASVTKKLANEVWDSHKRSNWNACK